METSIVKSYDEVERAAKAMAASGFFQDTKSISQAIVKIMAGQELGFGVFASMNGVYIIQGRPSIGANLMASAVKASGRYNYKVVEMSDKRCEIAFLEGGHETGRSEFTLEDAKKAGTKNLDKFPRNMLFARAMSNGVRWFCPDVMNGSTVYTPEELGADVDEDGNVINVESVVVVEPTAIEEFAEEVGTVIEQKSMSLESAMAVKSSDGSLYGDASDEELNGKLIGVRKALKKEVTPERKEQLLFKRDAILTIQQSRLQSQE